MKSLPPQYLSEFCMELALLVRAGVPISEGLLIMRDDDQDHASKELLALLSDSAESGLSLSDALQSSSQFPDYFLSMIRLGEHTGRLDDVLISLTTYYEKRSFFAESVRRAVLYPLMLIILLTAVLVVLVTQVLPIFHDVFAQVGAQMSTASIALMNFGAWLSSISALLLIFLLTILILILAVYKIPFLNQISFRYIENRFGDKGVLNRISSAKFAMAMAMAIASGLDPERAITLAGDICSSSYSMTSKITECKHFLSRGENLENSLIKSNIFSRRDNRILTLGAKTGHSAEVMAEIARRGEEAVIEDLEEKLKKFEPTLVIIVSLTVGLILFSVMLPLMGIMSSIG